jgi:hemerythrin
MSLQWGEALSVSNDLIDNDHKYLIDLINETELEIQQRHRTELESVLTKLTMYSQFHFAREEKIAAAAGFGEVAQMHDSHAYLLKKLAEFKAENEDFWSDASMDTFGSFLQTWLLNHVMKEDMLLKPFMEKFPRDFNPK